MIYTTEMVTQYDARSAATYEDRINEAIQRWQAQGLTVEVQYRGDATLLVVLKEYT